jgi:uncharacterized SAM-binding protein YcdF (DUF218 family)
MSVARRIWKIIAGLVTFAGLLLGLVMFTPVVPWSARKLGGPMDDPTGEVLVVLSGSALEDGIIGESSYWRCAYAVRAYRQTPFSRVILSGGGPFHAASAMRDFVVAEGVPSERVTVEDRSTSTHESAVYLKELLASTPGTIVLLTSDYHMFRSVRALRKAGLNVAPRPFPDVIKRSSSLLERWPLFGLLVSETAKIGYYWARGWI